MTHLRKQRESEMYWLEKVAASFEGLVRVAELVVALVPLPEALEDLDRLLHGRLTTQEREP